MLQPREEHVPALFLVLVFLPLAVYFLLGKWSEIAGRKARASSLARRAAAEEATSSLGPAERMACADVIVSPPLNAFRDDSCGGNFLSPPLPYNRRTPVPTGGGSTSKGRRYVCAACCAPAKTRCSRCKSVRYCSGKCQIMHWRDGHRDVCQQLHSPAGVSVKIPGQFLPTDSEEMIRDDDMIGSVPESPSNITSSNSRDSGVVEDTSFSDSRAAAANEHRIASSLSFLPLSSAKSLPLHFKSGSDTKRRAKSGLSSSEDRGCSGGGNKKPPVPLQPVASLTEFQVKRLSRSKSNGVSELSASEALVAAAERKKTPVIQKCNLVRLFDNKKPKVLFPYDELVKFFQYDVRGISPRGLLNCGNSCYANAVLQCLTCTKPLMIYLLQRLHSRNCRPKSWCLMCELEEHAMLLRESGAPLSPSRILAIMRSIGCRLGGGSQEDAHEFLRHLVMSMQSVCLEEVGGEAAVDPRLQETTLIQQVFGGRLKSKVKCLVCLQESETHESIMDLTLEIHGWVESLEDALTQFTAPEDLDSENMYRCGRCLAYVPAQKQLSMLEVPNILTIVLKRFQSGSYGKINKCVSFPEMLDMVPFMSVAADDIPPLYLLYAVVVHLDAGNASSGHYIAYVRDMRGTWLRINDTEIQVVQIAQVMSEGAYMLFYSRSSSPRPPKVQGQQQKPIGRPPRPLFEDHANRRYDFRLRREEGTRDFSEVSSSDWSSLFTSSDESSFTTESTRDSFSVFDCRDENPLSASFDAMSSSIFGHMYAGPSPPGYLVPMNLVPGHQGVVYR